MQSNRRPQTHARIVVAKEKANTTAVAARPVELDAEALKQIAGGVSPKGTWSTGVLSPKGTW